MRFIATFVVVVLALLSASVLGQNAQDSSAISELGALITDLPTIVEDGGATLVRQLVALLRILDPQGVVSDLPAVFSSNLPAIESYLADFLTMQIPDGLVPTSILTAIPALITGEGSLILSDLDAIVSQISGTIPISDTKLGPTLASFLPELATDIEGIASKLLLDLSKSLAVATSPANSTAQTTTASTNSTPQTTTASTNSTPQTTTPSITSPASTGGSATSTLPAAVSTAGAAAMALKVEVAGVLGFAFVVALL